MEYYLEYTDKNFHDTRQSPNIRHSYVIDKLFFFRKKKQKFFLIILYLRSESKFWPFLFKVALIVTVFFVVKSFLSGANRPGGVAPMSTGPDHRPPGKFLVINNILLFEYRWWRWWWRLVFKFFPRW